MGDLMTFFGRHVGASIFGACGVILAALGYADQAGTIITSFEPWQLQATGAALFVLFVIMVLASYDKAHLNQRQANAQPTPSEIASPLQALSQSFPEARTSEPSPDVLPELVVNAYLSLMTSKHTVLQEEKFLQPYDGKWMQFELEIASLEKSDGELRGQFFHEIDGRTTSSIFVKFPLKWKDHLNHIAAGDKLRFKAKVKIKEQTRPEFVEGVPL
jgi:hypothetical protein